jgi:ubiquinol-cytochrome c reductase cytochrome b subunit
VPFLPRVYAVHIFIVPAIVLLLLALHLMLVKRHGISQLPQRLNKTATVGSGQTEVDRSSTFSMHMRKLAGYGMFLAAIAAVLALAIQAPLGPKGVTGIEITRPPLEFLWLTNFENWFGLRSLLWVPAILMGALILLPFLDRSKKFHILDRKWVLVIMIMLILTWVGLTIYAGMAPEKSHLGM